MTNAIKVLLQMTSVSLQPVPTLLSAPSKCERISGAIETSSVLVYIK
jgi:hypothetical protein